MTVQRYIGSAPLIAQESLGTVAGTIIEGELFNVTIGNKIVAVPASSTTVNQTAEDIATFISQLNPTAYPEFFEFTAQANGATVSFTANTPGKPFTITLTTNSAGGTWVQSQVFANSGPNDVACLPNYSGNALPTNGDTLVIDTAAPDLLWNLGALSAVTLAVLTITSPTAKVGILDNDQNGYPQYRPTFLRVSATLVTVNTKSTLLRLDLGTAATTITVQNTGSSSDPTRNTLCLRGSNSANVITVTKGDVGLALKTGEAAQYATVASGYVSNVNGDANIVCGAGCTLAAIKMTGGNLTTNSDITTITQTGGTWTANAGACAASDIQAGTAIWNSTGTITTPKIGANGLLDASRTPVTKTVSGTVQAYNANPILDPNKTLNAGGTLTIQFNEVPSNLGANVTLART